MFTHNHARSLKKDLLFCQRQKTKAFLFRRFFLFGFQFAYPGGLPDMQKEGPSIQRPAAWYQKPFFNRRFFFRFSSL